MLTCTGFRQLVLSHFSLCMLLLSALAVPKIEIVPVFVGVAIATKGLQQIVGHVCRDLVGADLGIIILFRHFAPDYLYPTEPAKKKMSAPQWKATLVKQFITIIIYTKLTDFALTHLKTIHVISPGNFAQQVAKGQHAHDVQ